MARLRMVRLAGPMLYLVDLTEWLLSWSYTPYSKVHDSQSALYLAPAQCENRTSLHDSLSAKLKHQFLTGKLLIPTSIDTCVYSLLIQMKENVSGPKSTSDK